MSHAGRIGFTLVAILAAGAGGFWVGHRDLVQPTLAWLRTSVAATESAEPTPPNTSSPRSGHIIYYRHPDGQPNYSAKPTETSDGRNFIAVYSDEDLNFDKPPASQSVTTATPQDGTKRVLYYRNPMGLPDTSPTPKQDSMGMDYIPVYEGEDADGSTVRVSQGKLQRTGVRTALASQREIINPIRVAGTVQLDERRVTVVATRSEAFVNSVANVTTGDHVTKGQPLLQLYSPEIAAAGAQLLSDIKTGGKSDNLDGARQRLENLGVPQEAIAEIERARKVPLSMTWRAPRDGIVLKRNIVEGMKAEPGDVLFQLADLSTIWVLADIPEYQLGAVKVGAAATIRLRSSPERTFTGRVALIYPQVATETRSTRVRIELQNPDALLLPDMYADVNIESGDNRRVVAVPDSSIIDTGSRQIVIVDKGDGRFEPRDVKVGQAGGGFTEIRSGIALGEKIVVAANFLIDAESNLQSALSSMTSDGATP